MAATNDKLKTISEIVGKCPHCSGKKLRELMTWKENPYPPSQIILGPGAKNQLTIKTKTTIYCNTCSTIFKE